MNVGSVQALWRYPLKSALGERLGVAALAETGIVGDRAFALRDHETGRIASAKRPKLWRALLDLAAAYDDAAGRLVVTFPDGRRLDSLSDAIDDALSGHVGRPVSLLAERRETFELERARPDEVLARGIDADVAAEVRILGRAAPGSRFHDFAPVHILLAPSLRRIAEVAGRPDPEAVRYRANLLVSGEGLDPFAENDWIGRRLRVGDALLEIVGPTARCAIPILAHGRDVASDPAILRAIDRENRVEVEAGALPCLGVYARVLRAGPAAHGDPCDLE